MFDLRYHVASLAAVFIALTVGIVLGVGISDRGFLRKGERSFLEERISRLENQLDAANQRGALLSEQSRAADGLIKETYPQLVQNQLRGRRLVLVFVGRVDGQVETSVKRAATDAGAAVSRMRALRLPIDPRALNRSLAGQPQFASYVGRDRLEDLGHELGRELVVGGETPLWAALSDELVEERTGNAARPVDGVVVSRSADPEGGPTARFLHGLYAGLADSGVPAVGVEALGAERSAMEAFRRRGLSTDDWVDSAYGRLALVWLLAGGAPGSYGVKPSAKDGVIPPADSVPLAAKPRG